MQAFLFEIAVESGGLVLLLLAAAGCVGWARRGSFDPRRQCVRCGYPRGDDLVAPCTECGKPPPADARSRALPTWRWPALSFAGACMCGAAILAASLVHRPHFYPMHFVLSATWSREFRVTPTEVDILMVSYEGSGWMMGYDLIIGGPSMAHGRVQAEIASFGILGGSDLTTRGFVSLRRAGDRWTVGSWSPAAPDGATPPVGATVDASDLASWLASQGFPSGSDRAEGALRTAQQLLGGSDLSERAFGAGPLSGQVGDRFEQMRCTFHGRRGADSGGRISTAWNALRWSATGLAALALGGWAMWLLACGERSRRLVRDAHG